MRPVARSAGWLVLLLATACTTRAMQLPRAAAPRQVAPPPTSAYEVPGPVSPPLSDTLERTTQALEIRTLRLAPRLPAELAPLARATDPIEIRLYLPRRPADAPRPLVLMSPILGNKDLLMGSFAEAFARRGWITAVVERKELAFDPEVALEQAESELRLLVIRSRQALDHLLTRPDVDPRRLGTCGVSAGAIVSALVGGSDARFVGHVWILAGGPLADVMCDSSEGRFRRYGVALQERQGLSLEQIRGRLRGLIRTDPVLLAPHVPTESVLLMLARGDRSVPTRHGWTLYEALGRPALRQLPFGHYLSFAFLPYILGETTGFLAQRFAAPTRA